MVALIQNMEAYGLGLSEINTARTVVKRTSNWLLELERSDRRKERELRKQQEKEEFLVEDKKPIEEIPADEEDYEDSYEYGFEMG